MRICLVYFPGTISLSSVIGVEMIAVLLNGSSDRSFVNILISKSGILNVV